MQLLDGKALAAEIEGQITEEVRSLAHRGITPGLAVILVGNDPASQAYVRMKAKACKRAGIYSITHEMPENTTESQLLNAITILNNDPNIDGILVQL
ncbi:MAG: tetrahydrofolate dehydrogenase/cyclohydrolase catalytic domain-containing protein, partial [Wolinella sp.]